MLVSRTGHPGCGSVPTPAGTFFTMSLPAPPLLRFVVCGSDALAFRLASELVAMPGAEVTVVTPATAADADEPSPARVPGVIVVHASHLDRDVCRQIDLPHVDALALVDQNDGGNVNAALVAREYAPAVRLVIRIFDETLAESMHERLEDCAVLSSTAVAAPAFLAAALGGDLPTPLRVADRLLYVTERRNTAPANIVCVLSAGVDTTSPEILPDSTDPDDLVLTSVLSGSAPDAIRLPVPVRESAVPGERSRRAKARAEHGARIRRRARRRAFLAVASLVGQRLWLVVVALAVLLVAATTALTIIRHSSLWEAFYLALLNTVAVG
jgi:hypothetical protein